MKRNWPREFACLQVQSALNPLFWAWTFGGSVFLLFLNEQGVSKNGIGFALSLFPFCGLLALGFAPVAARWGRKRVFLIGYGARKLVAAGLLLLPLWIAHASRSATLVYLFAIVAAVAVLRALAETAYYPWSQEFVPNQTRGKFLAASSVVSAVAGCAAALIAGRVLDTGHGLNRFLWLIGVGCVFGLISVAAMFFVSGGDPQQAAASPDEHWADMRQALRDRNFRRYLGGMGCITVGSLLVISFLPLHLKDHLGLPVGTVVRLDAVMMIGGVVANLLGGWAADRVGSRPILMPALALGMLTPVAWLLLPQGVPHIASWCAAIYCVYGIAINGISLGAGRLLFNSVVPPEQSTAYTAIYYAWLGLTGGAAPLLAGGLLTLCAGWSATTGPIAWNGQALVFLLATGLFAMGWRLYGRVRPDAGHWPRGDGQQERLAELPSNLERTTL